MQVSMMKRGLVRLLCAASATFALTCAGAFAQTPGNVDTRTPDGTIRTLANSILETLKTDPQIQAGNMTRIVEMVNQKLLPYTDFAKTTRLAMGPGWRTATPQQREQLVQQFELLLVHTYAGATGKVGDQTVEIKPMRAPADATET